MTDKQIALYQKLVNLCNDEDIQDVITATSCLMCSNVAVCVGPKDHGFDIQNLVYRQIKYFHDVNKGKQIPMLEQVPSFISNT